VAAVDDLRAPVSMTVSGSRTAAGWPTPSSATRTAGRCCSSTARPVTGATRGPPTRSSGRSVSGRSHRTVRAWAAPARGRGAGCWIGLRTCDTSPTRWGWTGSRPSGSPTAGRTPPPAATGSAPGSLPPCWWPRCRRWTHRAYGGSSACPPGTTPLAARAPWALRALYAALAALARRNPPRAERLLVAGMSQADQQLFARPELAGRFAADLAGGGGRGVAGDEHLMPLPWGFTPPPGHRPDTPVARRTRPTRPATALA
jgi:hypothetical protein